MVDHEAYRKFILFKTTGIKYNKIYIIICQNYKINQHKYI